MMSIRFAFVGFRHGHIYDVLNRVKEHSETELVGACEEDAGTRAVLSQQGNVQITHENYARMLAEVECDVIAVGDVYARRGRLIIEALKAGKHVISDKPLCCRLDEFRQIKELAGAGQRVVGCQLDMRSNGALRTARQAIREGQIGEIHTVSFSGQHPVMLGRRPGWYFEPGQHGGTINDICVHAMDAICWITGRNIVEVVAARVWNAKTRQYPHFQDGAQIMLRMDNDGGVLGDVSYLAPDGCGYKLKNYWRFTFHGSDGVIEFAYGADQMVLTHNDDSEPHSIAVGPGAPGEYLQDFLYQIQGQPEKASLTTSEVFKATYLSLMTQDAAQRGLTNRPCEYKE